MNERDADRLLLQHPFPLLDSLRAVGALAVFTTHAAYWAGAYTGHGWWGTLLSRLDVGVAIFFVLSGFLLSRSYLARATIGLPPPPLRSYYWKRFLRIAPLYVLTAALALGLISGNRGLGPTDWVVTGLMANTFLDTTLPNGLTHMWSLAVEVTFYLLLPALMALTTRRRPGSRSTGLQPRRVLAVVLGMIVVSICWDLWIASAVGAHVEAQPGQWLPAYLGWFGIGIALALVELLHRRARWSRLTRPVVDLAHQPGACWAIVGGLMLVVSTPMAGPSMLVAPTPGQLLLKHVVYAVIGAMVVLTGVFPRAGGAYGRWLGHRRARHLGFISYGFFCLHLPVLHLVMWITGWTLFEGHFLGIWVVALALSLVVAEAAHRWLEAPLMRWRSRGPRPADSTTQASTGASAR